MSYLLSLKSTGRLSLLLSLVIALILATAGSAAAAYPGYGSYQNNACVDYSSNGYVDNAGAEACLWRVGRTASSYTAAGGAYDYRSEGNYAETTLTIQQLTPGGAVVNGLTQTVTTRGLVAGQSSVGKSFTLYKNSRASRILITLRACTVNASGVRVSCGTKRFAGNW